MLSEMGKENEKKKRMHDSHTGETNRCSRGNTNVVTSKDFKSIILNIVK